MRKEQEQSVLQLASGKDVFVCLPTGYGKLLCYTLLPYVFDHIRLVDKKSLEFSSPSNSAWANVPPPLSHTEAAWSLPGELTSEQNTDTEQETTSLDRD